MIISENLQLKKIIVTKFTHTQTSYPNPKIESLACRRNSETQKNNIEHVRIFNILSNVNVLTSLLRNIIQTTRKRISAMQNQHRQINLFQYSDFVTC